MRNEYSRNENKQFQAKCLRKQIERFCLASSRKGIKIENNKFNFIRKIYVVAELIRGSVTNWCVFFLFVRYKRSRHAWKRCAKYLIIIIIPRTTRVETYRHWLIEPPTTTYRLRSTVPGNRYEFVCLQSAWCASIRGKIHSDFPLARDDECNFTNFSRMWKCPLKLHDKPALNHQSLHHSECVRVTSPNLIVNLSHCRVQKQNKNEILNK